MKIFFIVIELGILKKCFFHLLLLSYEEISHELKINSAVSHKFIQSEILAEREAKVEALCCLSCVSLS